MPLPPGPYFHVDQPGYRAPFYALRFDEIGHSQGPLTRQHLLDHAAGEPGAEVTDVFVFSHGWNNDWPTALDRYRAFFTAYHDVLAAQGVDHGRPFRPMLVGIFWPSTALVLPNEQGPQFAGADPADEAGEFAQVAEWGARVPPTQRERFYALMESPSLTRDEATELLGVLPSLLVEGDEELPGDPGRDVDELLAGWAMYEAECAPHVVPGSATGFGAGGGGQAAAPQAAGFLDKLDPRKLLRLVTVREMKDRSGLIGVNGVGPLLNDLMDHLDEGVKIHLIGHSYGARVILNAVARPAFRELPRPVDSMLLLQPAINHLCFAEDLGAEVPGAYRAALPRVRQPILSTFSAQDQPLHDVFHLAMRRGSDLGEVGIASDEPPSVYAALGGYGPRGLTEWVQQDIHAPGTDYDLAGARAAGTEVIAVNGTGVITGHGEVVNPHTAWALFNLVRG